MKYAAFAAALLFAVAASAQLPTAPPPPSGMRAQVGIHVGYPLPLPSGAQPIATHSRNGVTINLLDVQREDDQITVTWSRHTHQGSYTTSATVAAPPAGTKVVTITIPGVDPFNVRIE